MATNIDDVGKKAVKLLIAIHNAKVDAKQTREMNRNRVSALRPLLQQVWDALERGETVQNCATKEDWAKRFANTSIRNLQYILAGGNKSRDNKSVNLNKVTHVIVNGVRYKLHSMLSVMPTAKGFDAYSHTLDLNLIEEATATQSKKPTVVKVTHSRGYTRKGTCSTRVTRCQNVYVNRKIKNKVFADKDENVTCPDCLRILTGQMPEIKAVGAPKVKKLSAADTASAIRACEAHFRNSNRDDNGYEWVKKYEAHFWAMVRQHPEWREQQIESARKQIVRMEWERRVNGKLPPKAKAVDPEKELKKRFRAAKRAANFYVGMINEMTAMRGYAGLLELWTRDPEHGDDQYPWMPPCKGYCLPKTEKEFEAEYGKAFAEFDKILAEGKAMGVLTDAPREKKPMHPAVKKLAEVVGQPLGESCEPESTE